MHEKTRVETVKTDSFAMEYFRFGHGEETLVILPGIGVQSVMNAADAVTEAYRLLADAFTVYLFERPNDLPEEYPVASMAADAAEAIRALSLSRVCLFGASMGGMIAMEIALQNPDLVGKLVLGSTCARVGEEQYRVIREWIRLAEAGNTEALYLSFGEAVYPKEVFEASKALLSDAAKTVTGEELKRFIIQARGIEGFDVSSELGQITCPVLVLGSVDDGVMGKDAGPQLAGLLTGSADVRLHMYSGYGHAAYDTAPDYRERMYDFLAR